MAIPYVKQTWTDDVSQTTAARMGFMETGIEDAHKMPCVRAKHSANQSLTTGTDTALALDSEDFDTHGMHSGVTNNSRLTCQHAGKYTIGANVQFANGTAGLRIIRLRVNGGADIALVLDGPPNTASAYTMSVTTIYDLSVNDYVEVLARQDSGGNLNVNFVSNYSPILWAVRVA